MNKNKDSSSMPRITPSDWNKFDWEGAAEEHGKSRMKKVLKYVPSRGLHLDVGTGREDGTYLVSRKKQTIGIDFGMKSLKIASRKNNNLIQADACNLPFESASFESVTFLGVIEHIPNYEKAAREIYRVLKPEGILLMQTPPTEFLYIKTAITKLLYIIWFFTKRILQYKKYANAKYYPQPYDQALSTEEARHVLISNNFIIKKERTVNYWHPRLVIRIFCFAKLFICTKRG